MNTFVSQHGIICAGYSRQDWARVLVIQLWGEFWRPPWFIFTNLPDLGYNFLWYTFLTFSIDCRYEYAILIFVLAPLQDQTSCSLGDFGPCSLFIHCSLEQIFTEVPSQIGDGLIDRVIITVEVGITLLGIWITILYLVVIQGLIDCFIILFIWHSNLTNILVIQRGFFSFAVGISYLLCDQ